MEIKRLLVLLMPIIISTSCMAMNNSDDEEEMYYIGGFGISYGEVKPKITEIVENDNRVFPYIEQDEQGMWWEYPSKNEERICLGENYIRNERIKKAIKIGTLAVIGSVSVYKGYKYVTQNPKLTKELVKQSTDTVIKVVEKTVASKTSSSSFCTIL